MIARDAAENRDSQKEDALCIATILSARAEGGVQGEEAQSAYRTLMRKYWRIITLLVASHVGDLREAEDITQESFLRAFRSLRRLKEPRAFLGWLMRIARNLATDRLRVRRPTVSLESLGDAVGQGAPCGHRQPTPHEERLETEEEVAHVLEAMARLPAMYREVVALKYLHGLDGRTMARLLDEPEGTVRNRLFRALEKLRETLEEGALRSRT
jgi:RNA polymerase sigma-70 factor (ECF subfamily)